MLLALTSYVRAINISILVSVQTRPSVILTEKLLTVYLGRQMMRGEVLYGNKVLGIVNSREEKKQTPTASIIQDLYGTTSCQN